MSKQFLKKAAASHAIYFFHVSTNVKWSQKWNEKRAAPPIFLRWWLGFNLPLYACRKKDHIGLFLNTNTGSERSKNAYKIDFSRL